MKQEQLNMFNTGTRMQMNESIEYTKLSLLQYGPRFDTWCIAWSGGKDSTTLLTLVIWLIKSGQVPAPKVLRVFYADTRLELSPLWFAAQQIIEELKEIGITVEVVMAPMEKRFMTYILGRGVPPPNNKTFRWCTRQIKVDPMKAALQELHKRTGEKALMLTGVRQGESAIRDQRIVMSCSKDGAECGQGWYQETMPEAICDTLAPILHWRVCHVWEWLKHWAPLPEYGDWSTEMIADAYGGDEAEEINARTGCMGCPLTDKDTALDNLLKRDKYKYLTPLKGLRPLWRKLRSGKVRLRKTGKEKSNKKNKQRIGPLTMECRQWAFNEIIKIQDSVNRGAATVGMPTITLIDDQEAAFIRKCWEENLWPQDWNGDEPTGDVLMDTVYSDGTIQPILFGN
jgi:DNA sulfur modification protein DndC